MKMLAIFTHAMLAAAITARHNNIPGNRSQFEECTEETAVQRKEYGSLTDQEKLSYIHGIQCLMRLPSHYPADVVPAATNRWLDFTATHVNLTLSIHYSGLLLPWHRHLLYLLEDALKTDCGYPQYLGIPYWNYPLYPSLADSPIFDGSHTSLGSNGSATDLCIEKGPFSNTTITFGPFPPVSINITQPPDWTQPKPHCMQRNLNDQSLQEFNNQSNVDALLAAPDMVTVERWLNSKSLLFGFTARGIHGGGHFSIGGTNSDFFASAQDPSFYLHHSMLDRLWAMWQDDHPDLRYSYNGTSTFLNPPGVTPEVDNSTVMTFGRVGDPITVGETADVMSGAPYCYIYL
ncbi:Tyrosinase [Cytospora mali]|uniref:Tyrosinase n=1 Tax=Cytospora mali TaxID=578113 RepID=A0A194VBC9_CYTMA|nr:Tyrosinase [Valsa mali var. pyri (nom. inval.)]